MWYAPFLEFLFSPFYFGLRKLMPLRQFNYTTNQSLNLSLLVSTRGPYFFRQALQIPFTTISTLVAV